MRYIAPKKKKAKLDWDVDVYCEEVPDYYIKEIIGASLSTIISWGKYPFKYNGKDYVIGIDKVKQWDVIRLQLYCDAVDKTHEKKVD